LRINGRIFRDEDIGILYGKYPLWKVESGMKIGWEEGKEVSGMRKVGWKIKDECRIKGWGLCYDEWGVSLRKRSSKEED
jgi:hypothetical protein